MSRSILIVVLLMIMTINILREEPFQIGIKKKVENYEDKSKKDDRLHTHYTVIDDQIFH